MSRPTHYERNNDIVDLGSNQYLSLIHISTRPLALVQAASLYCYGTDFNKNVTEVFDGQGTIAATYEMCIRDSSSGRLSKPGSQDHAIRLRPVRTAQDGNCPGRQPNSLRV